IVPPMISVNSEVSTSRSPGPSSFLVLLFMAFIVRSPSVVPGFPTASPTAGVTRCVGRSTAPFATFLEYWRPPGGRNPDALAVHVCTSPVLALGNGRPGHYPIPYGSTTCTPGAGGGSGLTGETGVKFRAGGHSEKLLPYD